MWNVVSHMQIYPVIHPMVSPAHVHVHYTPTPKSKCYTVCVNLAVHRGDSDRPEDDSLRISL